MQAKLPLVHATSVWNANEIINHGQVTTNPCKIFSKSLIYFFILRPAYLRKGADQPDHRISAFPAALIFKADAVRAPYHIYPFDTGAAISGAFDQQANPQIPLDDYALNPTHESASDFIAWAFGNLSAYYEGQVRNDLAEEIKDHDFVAGGYLDIARMGVDGSNMHDKRASSLELTSDHNVNLAESLELIILPKQFMEENTNFLSKLESLKTEVELYDWQPNRAPNEFQKDLMTIALNWYRQKGFDL